MNGKQLAAFMVGLMLATAGTLLTVLNDIAWFTIALQVVGLGMLGWLTVGLLVERNNHQDS